MKNHLLKTTFTLLTFLLFTSCGVDMFNKVSGNRNVITQERTTNTPFTSIKISTGLDLYITQSKNISISVEADENLQDIIITEVNNGVLKIYSEKNIWTAKAKKIYVSVSELEELRGTSGSHIYTENMLKLNNLKVITTSGANADISVQAENIETSATSGSDLRIMGTAVNHTSKATSGSSIKAYKLESKNTIVRATSGANIDIHASESIDAKATSGGDVDFKGNPTKVIKKSTSGGSVSSK